MLDKARDAWPLRLLLVLKAFALQSECKRGWEFFHFVRTLHVNIAVVFVIITLPATIVRTYKSNFLFVNTLTMALKPRFQIEVA